MPHDVTILVPMATGDDITVLGLQEFQNFKEMFLNVCRILHRDI